MRTKKERLTIGRSDIADFPLLGIYSVEVKIDTGAYNSSIHCVRAERNYEGDLEVVFLDPKHPSFTGELHVFEAYSQKLVRSSNGQAERRFMINTSIAFPGRTFEIDLSLANRGDMRFPVLIGRKFLKKTGFLIDPRRRNALSGNRS
jgi:hypothetical protein